MDPVFSKAQGFLGFRLWVFEVVSGVLAFGSLGFRVQAVLSTFFVVPGVEGLMVFGFSLRGV